MNKVNTLRWVREHFHKSQKELAVAFKTTTSNISRMEREEKLPKDFELQKLAAFYGCTVEFIKEYEPPTTANNMSHISHSLIATNVHSNHQVNIPEGFTEIIQVISNSMQANNALLNSLLQRL